MKIRLTSIDLRIDGKFFAIGSELIVDKDIPRELATRRLDRRTAELVVDGEAIPAAIQVAIATMEQRARAMVQASAALLDLVEAEPPTVVLAVIDALKAAEPDGFNEAFEQTGDRFAALHRIAAQARHDAEQVSSGVEQQAARLAQAQEVAGSNPAPASTDAPNSASAGGDEGHEPGGEAPPPPGSTNDPPLAADLASVDSQPNEAAESAPPGDADQTAPNDNPAESGGVLDAAAEASAPAAKPKKAAKAKPAANPGGGA